MTESLVTAVQQSSLHSLQLRNVKLNEKAIRKLGHCLLDAFLQHLDISNNTQLMPHQFVTLFEALSENRNLKFLGLSGLKLTDNK